MPSLRVLGWAPLRRPTWISPGDSFEAARAAAEANGLSERRPFFRRKYCGPLVRPSARRKAAGISRKSPAPTAFSSIATGRVSPENARRHARRRIGVRRTPVARARLPRFAYLDPGLPSNSSPRTGRERGGRPLSRILRGPRPEVAALLPEQGERRVTERAPATSKRPGHAQKAIILFAAACFALAVPACSNNSTTVTPTPGPSLTPNPSLAAASSRLRGCRLRPLT